MMKTFRIFYSLTVLLTAFVLSGCAEKESYEPLEKKDGKR